MAPLERNIGHDIALVVLLACLLGLSSVPGQGDISTAQSLLHLTAFVHIWFTMLLGGIVGPRLGLWTGMIFFLLLNKTMGPHGFMPGATVFGTPLQTGSTAVDTMLATAPVQWLTKNSAVGFALFLVADIALMQWASLQSASRRRLMWLGTVIVALVLLPSVLYPLWPLPPVNVDQAFASIEDIMADVASNPLVTPTFIVPEAWALPDYTVLRTVPSKPGGILAMFAVSLILIAVIAFRSERLTAQRSRWVWLAACLVYLPLIAGMGYLGALPAEGTALVLSRVLTVLYFGFFLTMPTLRRILSNAE